ncbi:MAG: AraC family transcriptional regulator [Clostridiaceae bacterium]|nr:AraC family transcriptional regulator [Clostridiaceae bacterium]
MKGLHESKLSLQSEGWPFEVFYNQRCGPGKSGVLRHWHEHLELLLLLRGECRLELEQQTLVLHEGDMVLLGAGTSHGIPDLADCLFYVLQFSPDWLQDMGSPDISAVLPFLQPDSRCLAHVSIENQPAVRRLLTDLEDDFRDKPPAMALSVKGSLLKLFAWLIRQGIVNFPANNQDMLRLNRLQPAFTYVQEHYSGHLDERTAAGLCFMSCHHFSRTFHLATGKRFSDYIRHIRLQEARRRLINSCQAVGSIAIETGFSSPSHFTSVFLRETGLTPQAYRKQNLDRNKVFFDSRNEDNHLS